MICPVCEAAVMPAAERCPHCGTALTEHAANTGVVEEQGIVEGVMAGEPISIESPPPPRSITVPEAPRDLVPLAGMGLTTVGRLSLPALLWRQPVVRALARAGMGTLALTLGMRMVRTVLARPLGEVVTAALPFARHRLDPGGGPRSPFGARNERGGEVVETFIYVRQVVRRR